MKIENNLSEPDQQNKNNLDEYPSINDCDNLVNTIIDKYLKEIVFEKNVRSLVDYIYYLDYLKKLYQEKFFAKYIRNNIQYTNIAEYIMTLESQVDAIVKRYERHLVNNDLDNALLAKNMIERRKNSIIFLQNSYNNYFEQCINKGLSMLEKKELADEDIQELCDLTEKVLNFELDNKNIRRR